MSKSTTAIINSAVLGGISDSPYMGRPNSLAAIVGFNLHRLPGLMMPNQKMSKYSPSIGDAVVDDLVKILPCSDGITRLFGKNSGKIWEIDSGGNFTQPAVIPIISDARFPTIVANDNTVGTPNGGIKTYAINSGGTGYAVGDVLTVTGGGGSGATITVDSVDGSGVILTSHITTYGSGYSTATGAATSGGGGSSATVDISVVGTLDWVNPSSVMYDDSSVATFTTVNDVQTSHYLKATGFGFSIPTGAIIKGVIVETRIYDQQNGSLSDWTASYDPISLVKGGTITGTTLNGQDGIYSLDQYSSKGKPNDLWGISLTYSDVNASNFGVAIAVTSKAAIVSIGAGVFDAKEYYGKVYYAMANYLGQFTIGESIVNDRIDNFGLFLNQDTFYHPMLMQNRVLYIGDGNVVAQVDSSGLPYSPITFSDRALGIVQEERVSSLGLQSTNLLVGSKNVSGFNLCAIYNWDTYSKSFNQVDYVSENGVNSFIPDKTRTIISAGENGNFYQYVRSPYGVYLEPLDQMPPDWPNAIFDPSNKGLVHHTAVDVLQMIPIFGFSRTTGNPSLQGIYSLGSRDVSYPDILVLEFPVSSQNLRNLTIWSLVVVGNDVYCSYMDETTDPENPTYSLDKLDWSNKQPVAYFETMIMRFTTTLMDTFRDFVVGYDKLEEGSIDFYYNLNKQGYVKFNTTEDPNEFINDADRKIYEAHKTIQGRTVQFKVVVNAVGNKAPNIEDMSAVLAEGE